MKRIVSLFLVVIVLVLSLMPKEAALAEGVKTPSGIEYGDIASALDEYVKKYESGLASCEVAVFDRTGIIATRYYGYSDIENKVPADENMVYDWASCSKILVWVSVMQQVEKGKIDFETDIREYLPKDFLTKLQYEDEKITMINLMNHNAGFQESYYENQMCKEDEVFDNLEEALRACECYQAYHVGEYTAYSNYGTALAAFVVECVTGMDYREYVTENIFKPLGMKHTSIDTRMTDNTYVKETREKLKSYSRYDDPKYNEDYGVLHSWVQLYPAGSAIGTLEDLTKLGIALSNPDSVLFEDRNTWEEMISPTSFFGDSEISKNCHGLWTTECKIQIIGHAGNDDGCSSMLCFDPVSGLGVVIMTNEKGETIFNYGIPNLLFGEITDRPEYAAGYIEDADDISGIYFSQRNISEGAVNIYKYSGLIFPINKNKEGNYNLAFGGLNVDPDNKLYKIADNQYVLERNGMKEFLYYSVDEHGVGRLEMMSQDIITSKADTAKMVFLFSVDLLGVICGLVLVIKGIILLVKMLRKKQIKFNKQILATQIIYLVNLIVIMVMLNVTISNTHWFTVVSALLALAIGLGALLNGAMMVIRTVKEKPRIRTMINRYFWSVLSVMYMVFIVAFQVYKFWTL